MKRSWKQRLADRLGWSLGAAAIWTWGLLGLRSLRDGLAPLEVWFSYGLSFLMTAVYVYLGLLIVAALRAEGGGRLEEPGRAGRVVGRWSRPVALLGVGGLVASLASIVGWLLLRYPGPEAATGTVASLVLTAMVAAVAIVATWLTRAAEPRGGDSPGHGPS